MTRAAGRWLPALALVFTAATAAAAEPGELLAPEKAFRMSVRPLDARTVEVEFRIADGYYMYRDRFRFATESGKAIADVRIPRGKLKHDEFFGTTETFRHRVSIRVPLRAGDIERGSVRLQVTSQGCADVGVCYVPLEQHVTVNLPGRGNGAGR
jgi:thiol:disulfide interchange protein DsbD